MEINLQKQDLTYYTDQETDQVAVTVSLAAAGAHMVLFTTGRGTPLEELFQLLKISTNTDLYNKKKHWIDF
ncbi:MAG: hypothetical protein ACLTDP_11545 [Terrisporobacter sp.]